MHPGQRAERCDGVHCGWMTEGIPDPHEAAPDHALLQVRRRDTYCGGEDGCEPAAGEALEENLNSIGRNYYSASTMIRVPTSLAQETGLAIGAQAWEKQLAGVIRSGGFDRVRRVTTTSLNRVLDAA